MRVWAIFGLFLILCAVGVVLAKSINNVLSEDADGDGMPTIVEKAVGTNPNDPLSCITVKGISYVESNNTSILIEVANVTVGGG